VFESKGDLSAALKEYALAAELGPKEALYEKHFKRVEQKLKEAPSAAAHSKD
jgi:hypothetical protein